MKVLKINGGKALTGTIRISGAKNASVALIPAAILADDEVTICNVPEITDTDALTEILEYLGADVKRASESILINPTTIELPAAINAAAISVIIPLSFPIIKRNCALQLLFIMCFLIH